LKIFAFAAALSLSLLVAGLAYGEESKASETAGPGTITPNAKFVTKLAGLVLFVTDACPKSKVDYDRFKAIVSALGIQVSALSEDPIKLESLGYFTSYKDKTEDNCARALKEFGPDGRIIRGIFGEK